MSALRDAYELIKDEERWCQGHMAENRLGDPVAYDAFNAVRWCASGAVAKAFDGSGDTTMPLERAAAELFPEITKYGFNKVVCVNDRFGHEAVMQVFEKAIVQEEGSL